jgi:hypothetical protein
MDFATFRALALERLAEQGHDSPHVAMLRYSDNLAELTSDLRERVFRTDAKTAAFLQSLNSSPPQQQQNETCKHATIPSVASPS